MSGEVQEPDFGDADDWTLDTDHPFVGMDVEVETESGTRSGEIAGIWVYQGEPERIDIKTEDGARLNTDRAQVEVAG